MAERFTLLTELGRGGMGVVWKARDEETGQIVALKLLREAYAEDPEYLARFERELELAKRIDSVHVVKVLGYGVRDKVPYLALEYVDGPSLHDALLAHGPYSWPEARALLIQLTQGLADANAAGVIHRDVKPSNVLIGPDGLAKLTNFGIARGLEATRMTATSAMLGTPAYLAPEGPKDARSDLYSLGIIGYQLLTGAVPFKGTSHQEVIFEHVRTPPDLTVLPPEAQPIIGMLLAKDPAARPPRASALLPILYGVEQVPVAQEVGAGAAPVQPGASQALARQQRSTLEVAHGSAYPAPDRSPAAARRTSTPVIFSLAITGLVVCLLAAALAGSFLSSKPTSLATFTPPAGATEGAMAAPNAGAFSSAGSMTTARVDHTATRLPDGRVLIAGGHDYSLATLATAELYDPKTGAFTATGSMTTVRANHTATLLSDGRVLIAGGRVQTTTGDCSVSCSVDDVALASAELYDPKTGAFTATGSMTAARTYQIATALADGRVLVAGGFGVNQWVASAELYDPKTGRFTATGSMATDQSGGTATLLSDGRVMIAGGGDSAEGLVLASTELYDPKTGAFTATGSMTTARTDQIATALADGRVLIAGGQEDISGTILASAELYDPKTGRFTATGSMTTDRDGHTATLLADGRVLIAGGASTQGGSSPKGVILASAELYSP